MKINRKDSPKRMVFGDIHPSTTFTLEGRTAVFMKVDMSNVNFYCGTCDSDVFVDNDYALNLATSELEEFDYRMPVNPIECELNEI